MSRKIFWVLFFTGSFFSLNAQYILSEDFQHGIPATWTLINIDNLTPDSTVSFVNAAWVTVADANNASDSIAVSTSKYNPAGTADDWLISPAITLGSSGILTWYARAYSATAADGYQVKISTTTATIPGFNAHPALFTVFSESTAWTKHSVDLAAAGYANQSVRIAFRNNSNNKFLLAVNDVKVFDCNTFNADAGVIDTSTTAACGGTANLNLGLSPSFLASTPVSTINGNTNDIADWSPLPAKPFPDDGTCCDAFPFVHNPPYQKVGFQVTVTGIYNINQTQSGYDGVIYLYTDPFDLTLNPPISFVAGNDDDQILGLGFSEIAGLSLTAGQHYYLVSSGYDTGDFGNYATTFTGPGGILIEQATLTDMPFDYNYVVSNSIGTIVSTGDDLTNLSTFPGSLTGDTFNVCGISYVAANLNLASYIGQPFNTLSNDISSNNCADITTACHKAVVFSGANADAGVGDTICSGTAVTLTASGGVSYSWNTEDVTASIVVTPTITAIYTVTVTNSLGCTASDDVTVEVFASDAGTFSTGPTSACEGDPVLNLALTPEFSKTFYPANTDEINGSTLKYFTWDPLPGRPFEDGTCCSGNNPTFNIQPFQVDATGDYSFLQYQLGYDGIIYVYTDPFDLTANPPVTFIAANDDSAGNVGISYLPSVTLQLGRTYYLISAGFSAGEYGDYLTAISGPGNLFLPGPPDVLQFGYEFLTVNSAGTIVAFSKDLSNATTYPGSATGENYSVCSVSYLRDSVDIAPYLGQPYSTLANAGGCLDVSDDCHSVKIFNQPLANAGPDDTVCVNTPLTLAGNTPTSGTGEWFLVSGIGYINDGNSPTASFTGLAGGFYTLRWTIDNGGCTDADTMNVFVIEPAIDAGENVRTCFRVPVTLVASGSGSIFEWSNGVMNDSNTVQPPFTITYSVTITDADGCKSSDDVTVTVNPLPIVNIADVTICPGSTTILDAGNAGSTYSWSSSATTQTISVNAPGSFSVTVTNTNGCSSTDGAIVSFGSGLTVILDDITLCEGDSVTYDAGNPGANYSWSTGDVTQAIRVGEAGIYSVSVVDANNCSGSDSAVVTVLPLPSVSVSNDESICEGESVTLSASGSGTLQWSTGDTSSSITVSPTETEVYEVTVTGGNGCTVSEDIAVSVNTIPIADAGANQDICSGETAHLTATGGVSYSWSTGQTSADINVSPLTDETYYVTVTTGSNCSASDSIIITVRTAAVADAGVGDTLCAGESATLQASGGGTYLWENGNANSFITVTPDTSQYYSVTVTAANGCKASDSVFVKVNPVPTFDFGSNVDLCTGTSVMLSAFGGDSYFWSTGETTASIVVSPLADQVYSVTASTTAGCSISDTVLVQVRPVPVADAGSDTSVCEGYPISILASGGSSYHWSTGSNSNPLTISPTSTATYYVTVSNSFGCEDVDDVIVTVNPTPEVTLFGFDSTFYCIDHAPIIIAGSPPGGTLSGAGVSNGQFNPAVAGVGVHTIAYSLTALNGCTGIDSKDITIDLCNAITGIQEDEILIYPNPAEKFIIIEWIGLKDEVATIKLFDPIGKLLLTQIMNEKKKIDLSSYAAGQYLLQIRGRERQIIKQIVKN